MENDETLWLHWLLTMKKWWFNHVSSRKNGAVMGFHMGMVEMIHHFGWIDVSNH